MSEYKTGVYSNTEIIEAIDRGHIVQYPAAPELINASSIDVRLGRYFYRTDVSTEKEGFYNPYDKDDVERYFGNVLEAKPLREHDYAQRELGLTAIKGLDPDHPLIILRPGERILAHTHEFIGIKAPGTSSMHAKSTTGRNGLTVCNGDAGWGDPGYINRWTMEIQNNNEREHIPLPVGMRIAQIAFHHTGPVKGDYTSLTGNYQSSTDIDELVRDWDPSSMLSRAYRTPVELPPALESDRF